ncbi:uncharacterized protein LOC110882742 [Helianthus annuus]|uniref:uncharacterized protein LOC110882742 n=1 Tax=Helianthus annuus TaxID=4232 RepID=UPI000B8FB97C|nr:uncharacterized protein LOC110882742 [Helianthus annuus]
MSLNIRGVVGPEKSTWVKRLKKDFKFWILALQETHQVGISEEFWRKFWDRSSLSAVSVDAVGRSGGLAFLWDPDLFKVDKVLKGQRFIVVSGFMCGVEDRINFLNIYAPNDTGERTRFWGILEDIRSQLDGMCLMAGDFNEVRCPEDRLNSAFDKNAAANFNDSILRMGLLEYEMTGGKFTYVSSNEEIKMSKLDRILVCQKVLSCWPYA